MSLKEPLCQESVVVSLTPPLLSANGKLEDTGNFAFMLDSLCAYFNRSLAIVYGGADHYKNFGARNPGARSFEITQNFQEEMGAALKGVIMGVDYSLRSVTVDETQMLIDARTLRADKVDYLQEPRPVQVASSFEIPKKVFNCEDEFEDGGVVLCGGGGGVAVYKESVNGVMRPFKQDLLIDHDWTASVIARQLRAKVLVLLSNSPGVYSSGTEFMPSFTLDEIREFMRTHRSLKRILGQKLLAASEFVGADDANVAVITNSEGLWRLWEDDFSQATTIVRNRKRLAMH